MPMIKQIKVNSVRNTHETHLSHFHVSKMNMADSSFDFQI
jgi:hypothetical protein